MIDCRAHVGDDLIVANRAHQAKRAGKIVVADYVVGLAKIKVRRNRDETLGRELVSDASDLIIESERLHPTTMAGIRPSGRRAREMRGHFLAAGADGYFTRNNFHKCNLRLKIRAVDERRAIRDRALHISDPSIVLAYNEVRLKRENVNESAGIYCARQ